MIARWYALSGRNVRAKYAGENRGEFAFSGQVHSLAVSRQRKLFKTYFAFMLLSLLLFKINDYYR
jgi:hypothetical protein